MLTEYFIKKFILKNFFKIDLTNNQQEIAENTIREKYGRSIRRACFYSIFMLPAVLLLDTNILSTVLIPITMVTGTAWFGISIANIKKKFERFGLELTTNMFTSFITSLLILVLIVCVSLNTSWLHPVIQPYENNIILQAFAGLIGSMIVCILILDLFLAALKYDINDAMLAGQTEVAERFFQKSLSVLYSASQRLRTGRSLQVANYYIGVCFYELYHYLVQIKTIEKTRLDDDIKKLALELRGNPSMSQEEADMKSYTLIRKYLEYCINITDEKVCESYENVHTELEKIRVNRHEEQHMIDTRFAIIFEELADMLEIQGKTLFIKPKK